MVGKVSVRPRRWCGDWEVLDDQALVVLRGRDDDDDDDDDDDEEDESDDDEEMDCGGGDRGAWEETSTKCACKWTGRDPIRSTRT